MSDLTLLEIDFRLLDKQHLKAQRREQKAAKLKKQSSNSKDFRDADSQDFKDVPSEASPDLEQGKTLPEYLQGDVPDEYKFQALVDPDEYYSDKQTYVILDANYSIWRFTSTWAFYCIPPLCFLRVIANKILVHRLFNNFIMLTILTNCFFMAYNFEDPVTKSNPDWIDTVEKTFLAIYTVEMSIKMISRGFAVDSFTYLRDAWNILDIIIIFSAYFELVLQVLVGADTQIPGVSGLRALRVLRALKAISAVPGLKAIVSALIQSIKELKDVGILFMFCLSVFALIALQLFKGTLRNKCVRNYPWDEFEREYNATLAPDYTGGNWSTVGPQIFTKYINEHHFKVDDRAKKPQFRFADLNGTLHRYDELFFFNESAQAYQAYENVNTTDGHLVSLPMWCSFKNDKCENTSRIVEYSSYEDWILDDCNYCFVNDAPWLCGNGTASGQCWEGFTCMTAGENPNYGYTSYDNFPMALLALFRALAQDYWENLYQLTLRANGQVFFIYFLLVIFIGSFYLINLILAVVAMAYENQHQVLEQMIYYTLTHAVK